jgi:hypothetical protein
LGSPVIDKGPSEIIRKQFKTEKKKIPGVSGTKGVTWQRKHSIVVNPT